MATRQGQNIFDIAVERYGELDFASELVQLNRVGFDGDLLISDDLESDERGKGDEAVKKDFKETAYTPVNG